MKDVTGFIKFNMKPNGAISVDRDSLHASDGYKRQVKYLLELAAFRGRDVIGGFISPSIKDCQGG